MALGRTGLISDKSVTSLTGSSQSLLAANPYRNFLLIENIGNANIGVNLAGGTASIGGTGTLTIVPNGSLVLEGAGFMIGNAANVIGTAGQPVCCYEG